MKTPPDPLNDPNFADVVSRLRAQPAPEPSADFTERTLALAQRPPAPRIGRFLARAAAALALIGGAGLWFVRAPLPLAQAPAPIDVLMAAQRADGGWSASDGQLHARYDVGVTSLALLALMKAETAPLAGPQADAIRAGVAHLLRQQRGDGRFGEDFSGAGFTQYLASMALQAAARLPGAEADWANAADRAALNLPSNVQMAKLNGTLAHPETFPARWADAGGPVTLAALQMLSR
ncbi:MAG TPA: hypothetical protein PK388_10405 [Kiritimatiellia bacterium]|nr:hypothetical protein [Kiritimatiellia bacterium]